MQNTPPGGPNKRVSHWAKRKKFQLKHLPQYILGFFLRLVSRWLNLHPKAVMLMRRGLELGNPTNTIWPSETIPMNSRLFAGGFWNYGFFQFHRNFYFPFWAEMQYDPGGKSFIPRSHNILSMNQTQRNWVAVSYPGKEYEVSIDLAGAVMPELDSYTVEFAIIEKGKLVRPHQNAEELKMKSLNPSSLQLNWQRRVITITAEYDGVKIEASGKGNLIVAIRPFNMEGVSFIDRLSYSNGKISGDISAYVKNEPALVHFSNLTRGDALREIPGLIKEGNTGKEYYRARRKKKKKLTNEAKCHAGLVTSVFFYNDAEEVSFRFQDRRNWRMPAGLTEGIKKSEGGYPAKKIWEKWFPDVPRAKLPAPFGDWFADAANNLLTLWDYDSITPGSFTYHHFWIRDAVIMLNSLMILGGTKAAKPVLEKFPGYVRRNGLFASQAGEWDANGQALWILGKYTSFSGDAVLLHENRKGIRKMVRWIADAVENNGGVIPPGFSAEHLGVADWYLWDNFWTLGGLAAMNDYPDIAGRNLRSLQKTIEESLEKYLKNYKYYPAALGRKKDAGMIGSIAGVYPMALSKYFDPRMKKTLDIIREQYFVRGGFFQENIHSGINPYLTLQIAQSYLFMGEAETAAIIVSDLSKWARALHSFPEAVHPKTRGGCMGDGFHGWAFAELISYIKNVFILELDGVTILGAGIPESWFQSDFSIHSLHTESGTLDIEYKSGYLSFRGLRRTLNKTVYLSLPEKRSFVSGGKMKPVKISNGPHFAYAKNRKFYHIDDDDSSISEIGIKVGK